MAQATKEGQSGNFLSRRLPRRDAIEKFAVYGGILVSAYSGLDYVFSANGITKQVNWELPPVFQGDHTRNWFKERRDALAASKRTPRQEQTLDMLNQMFIFDTEQEVKRQELADQHQANEDQVVVLGLGERKDLRQWGFWGGLASAGIGLASKMRPERLIRRALNALPKAA